MAAARPRERVAGNGWARGSGEREREVQEREESKEMRVDEVQEV